MCGIDHPHLCHCLGALLLRLARARVTSTFGLILGFVMRVLIHHQEHTPLHHLHLDVASRSLC